MSSITSFVAESFVAESITSDRGVVKPEDSGDRKSPVIRARLTTNNDTALEQLNKHLPVNKVTQRLRYAGHIYNLVCNAILYGINKEASQDALQSARKVDSAGITNFNTTLRNGSDEEQLIVWRKKGPIGKLHNTMVHIKANNQRREIFEGKQREVIQEVGDELITSKIYRAVTNGGIRWNSTYLMIERVILLKDAISLYQGNTEAPIDPRDELTGSD
jgi:hypothetical protein